MSSFVLLFLIVGPLSGGLIAYNTKRFNRQNLSLFLAFAGSYLLAITLINLVPEVFEVFDFYKGLLVLAGFVFQIFLEKYSKGVEHGHILNLHHLKDKAAPVGIFLSLSMHSFAEGFPLGTMLHQQSAKVLPLMAGIALHEAPAAFAMVSILKSGNFNKTALKILLMLYACMAMCGAFTSYWLETAISINTFNYLLAFVIGTFLHISTTILFENSEHHRFSNKKIAGMLVGILIAILINMI